MKAFMRNTYNQTSVLRAQIQCLLKEEKAASILGCSLSANPGGLSISEMESMMIPRDHASRLLKRFLSVYALCGWVGRFSSLQPILSNCWRREYSLMVVSAQVRGVTPWFFFFCPYKEILRTFFGQGTKNSGKEERLPRKCPFFPPLYFIYSKILNLWEWFLTSLPLDTVYL